MRTTTIFLFLILIVNIQPGSLLKLPAHSAPLQKPQHAENSRVNKELLRKDPDPTTSIIFKNTTSPTTFSTVTQAHYSLEPFFFPAKSEEKSERKTNSSNSSGDNILLDDPNETGKRSMKSSAKSMSDNNDDGGRQFSSKKTKTTTAPRTFDPSATTTTTTTPTHTSTNFGNRSHERVRHTRSLKNDTDAATKVVGLDDGGADGGTWSEKNPDDEYHGRLRSDKKEKAKRKGARKKNFTAEKQDVQEDRDDDEAIESYQKTFVNENDISVLEEVAFDGMDMGILEKFQEKHGAVESPRKEDDENKGRESGDKKSIQEVSQLSPSSELRDGNKDIKMQEDLKHLTTTAKSSVTSSFNANMKEKDDIAVKKMTMRVGESEAQGIALDENDEDEVVKEAELFEDIVVGAPEGIDSAENSSSFYYHYSSNTKNKGHEQHRQLRNQSSSKLTFASFADLYEESRGSDRRGTGTVNHPDFEELAASTSASADEVKLYRLVQRLLKESPLIDG